MLRKEGRFVIHHGDGQHGAFLLSVDAPHAAQGAGIMIMGLKRPASVWRSIAPQPYPLSFPFFLLWGYHNPKRNAKGKRAVFGLKSPCGIPQAAWPGGVL